MKVVSVLALLSAAVIASAGPVNGETAKRLSRPTPDNAEALAKIFREALVKILNVANSALSEGEDLGGDVFWTVVRKALVKAFAFDGKIVEPLSRSEFDNPEFLARTFGEALVNILNFAKNALADGEDIGGMKLFREALAEIFEFDGEHVARDASWKHKVKKWLDYVRKFAKRVTRVTAEDVSSGSPDIDGGHSRFG